MNAADDDEKRRFYLYCFIALFITCILIAYLLYWFIRRLRMEKFSKIRIKSKKNLKKKKKDEIRKSKEEGSDNSYFIGKCKKNDLDRKKSPDEYSISSLSSGKKQQQDQEDSAIQESQSLKIDKSNKKAKDQIVESVREQPNDYSIDIRGVMVKKNSILEQYDQQQPSQQRLIQIPQIKVTSIAQQKPILLVEPNKYLKEVGINQEEEQQPQQQVRKIVGEERLRPLGSKVNASKSSLDRKKMDSAIIAYTTTPISGVESSQDVDSVIISNNTTSSKESNKNTTSILSLVNSQGRRSDSNVDVNVNQSNVTNNNQLSNLNQSKITSFVQSKLENEPIIQQSSKILEKTTKKK